MSATQTSEEVPSLTGRIEWAAGGTAPNVRVTGFNRLLRDERILGEATTSAEGRYRITYSASEVPEGRVNLVVRAEYGGVTVESPVLFGAGSEEEVDLVLPGGAPEYERLRQRIGPLLGDVALTDLVEDGERHEVSFLAAESGADGLRVAELVLAQRHADATGLSAELFYGLFRQGLPADLSALAQQPVGRLREALAAAVQAGVIADRPPGEMADFASRLRASEVAAVVGPPDGAWPNATAEIFAMAVPDQADRERIYAAYLDHRSTPDEFWQSLDKLDGLGRYAGRLRLALKLAALTADNPALVRLLLERFDAGEFSSLRDLAGLSVQDWRSLVAAAGGPRPMGAAVAYDAADAGDGGGTDRYVRTIEAIVADAYPTPAFARRMTEDASAAGTPAAAFLRANPGFDLRASQVDRAVREGTLPEGADAAAVRTDLAALQRVFKIAPRYEAARALRAAGFDSAQSVARMGRNAFVREFGSQVGEEQARLIHDRAQRTHAAALTLLGDYHAYNQLDVPWLPKLAAPADRIPDWERLFGSLDYCSCPGCRAVYSPAAYLVDLLSFLTERTSTSGRPVSEVLFSRRDDLRDIELTCGNTNTSLPYTDLVTEVLESAIAPETAVPAAERQTTATTAELRAQPQHVNPGAYAKLGQAVYPWELPFDLWGEEARAFLGYLNVPRDTVMTAFGTASPSELEIATEYLGMSTTQRQIITAGPLSPARTLSELYGCPHLLVPYLVKRLQRVPALLDAAGLRYADLAELLRMRFVNAGALLTIETQDSGHPCDTTKMWIPALNAAVLERLHRFVRLQRALGWAARDLDRAIAALTPGAINADTIRELATAQWLAGRLGLTIDEVLTFFTRLDTYNGYGPAAAAGQAAAGQAGDGQAGDGDAQTPDQPRYDRLFLNPAVVTPVPGQPSPFALREPDRTELAVIGDLGAPVVSAALLGVLGVSDAELAALTDGPHAVVTDDRKLNLQNLSVLVRTVSLARALDLPIPDLLRLIELSGIQPFPVGETVGPDVVSRARRFVEMADKLKASGLSVPEAGAVLDATADPGTADPAAASLPEDAALAATLTQLRAALQAIARDTADDTDERGDRTRKQLALLGWDAALIDQAVATLLGSLSYPAPLPALPAGLQFPSDLASRVRYDADAGQLTFTGPMTTSQLGTLQGLSADAAYQTAVQALFDAPRRFVAQRMKALVIPITAAPLDLLPPGYAFPPEVAGKVFYDPDRKELRCRGYLTDAQADALRDSMPAGSIYQGAVDALIAAQEDPPEAGNELLDAADAGELFSPGHSPADRFHLVLTRVLPFLCRQLSETAVKQKLGEVTGLDPATADGLLGRWLRSPSRALALLDFLADDFIRSDPVVAVSRSSFPDQMAALQLLHRVALALIRLGLTGDQLRWVFGYAADAGWLDLNQLPSVPASGSSPLFGSFLRLLDAVRLRNGLPGGQRPLGRVWELSRQPDATADQLLDLLGAETGWDRADLAFLVGTHGFGLTLPDDLRDERALLRLRESFRLLRALGVSANRVQCWTPADVTREAAQAAWLAAKAKHPLAEWLPLAATLRDQLRERQRSSLVAYLVAYPPYDAAGFPQWSDADGLYEYFLIDVEMTPGQLTSRIVQAISSVQLFAQRCLLNLEPQVSVDVAQDDKWAEWDWRQKYRLWEANQKIWLYPENYIEPELRDDKTPFFVDLENELRQKEITPENAETAFLHYLEKLDNVARLLPCGTYHEYDNEDAEQVERLHVVARTDSTPHVYYYRTWVNRLRWTPWEKIDLDIEGGTVTPVVWNRRPHLFWVSFIKKSDPPRIISMPSDESPMETPKVYWNMQLNWSQYRNGTWQPKKIGKNVISTWVQDENTEPDLYVFHPEIDASTGDLTVKVRHNAVLGGHEINIRGLSRTPGISPRLTTAKFIVGGSFHLSARAGTVEVEQEKILINDSLALAQNYVPPPGTIEGRLVAIMNNNEFIEAPGGTGELYLPAPGDPPSVGTLALSRTPSVERYHLLYPHQYFYSTYWAPFTMFFTDGARSYLLLPANSDRPALDVARVLAPGAADDLHQRFLPLAGPTFPALLPRPSASFSEPGGNGSGTAARALAAPSPGGPVPAAGGPASGTTDVTARGTTLADPYNLALPGRSTGGAGEASAILAVGSAPGALGLRSDLVLNTVRFANAYHPYVDLFISRVNRFGLSALFDRTVQTEPDTLLPAAASRFDFQQEYGPSPDFVDGTYPVETVDFDQLGATSRYNWELFFHAPLLLAQRLSDNQRFDDAQRWFHTIFDPTDRTALSAPGRYWRTKPFFETTAEDYQRQRIEDLLRRLADGSADPALLLACEEWRENPFQPHVVARSPHHRLPEGGGNEVPGQPDRLGRPAVPAGQHGVHQRGHPAVRARRADSRTSAGRGDPPGPARSQLPRALRRHRTVLRSAQRGGAAGAGSGAGRRFGRERAAAQPRLFSVLLPAQERQAARVLVDGGEPAVQHPSRPEHRRGGAPARVVRAGNRCRSARPGGGRWPGPGCRAA